MLPGKAVKNMTNSRNRLLRQIQIYAFAVNEAILYLDTHTDDAAALAYYDKYRARLREAIRTYEENYGPITADTVNTANGWSWVKEPWPWEYEP